MSRTIRLGVFTAIGIFVIVGFSIYVNDRPYWYRPCNRVGIQVDDATGLRRKSPVKTLGLEIGFIENIELAGERVLVNVCITGPVKLTAETKAFIRSAGFLGDKFLELKPVEMSRTSFFSRKKDNPSPPPAKPTSEATPPADSKMVEDKVDSKASGQLREELENEEEGGLPLIPTGGPAEAEPDYSKIFSRLSAQVLDLLFPTAHAADDEPRIQSGDSQTGTLSATREAEIQDTLKKVGKLIDQLTLMVEDVREITSQKEFKETVKNLSAAMKNLELTLKPNGKLVGSATQAMESMRDAMKHAEEVMAKINKGEGTIGKFVNDPTIYDEMKAAINSVNLLLGKAGTLKTFVDLSTAHVEAYEGYKSRFNVMIRPNPGRYYLLGIAYDPRGKETRTTTTTIVNNGTPSVEDKTVNQESGIKVTAMFGKYFGPLDLRVGFMDDSGALGIGFWLDEDRRFGIQSDIYKPSKREKIAVRAYARAQIYSGLYIFGGIDNHNKYQGKTTTMAGVGLFFDDDDLKYLLAFK